MDPVLENVLVELLVDLPADADIPVVASAPERTWLWSDLHLSDPSVLLGWGRPFGSVEEMNRHLLRNWRRRVGASDTVICLGDVAHPDAWRDDRLVLDLAECPGERLLVLGNHERRPGAASNWLPEDLPDRVVRHRSAAGADPHTAAEGTGRGRKRPRSPAPGRRADQPARQRVRRAHRLRPRGTHVRPRACLQTPGTERRHATTGFAVAVGGEELPTVAAARVGALAVRVVALDGLPDSLVPIPGLVPDRARLLALWCGGQRDLPHHPRAGGVRRPRLDGRHGGRRGVVGADRDHDDVAAVSGPPSRRPA